MPVKRARSGPVSSWNATITRDRVWTARLHSKLRQAGEITPEFGGAPGNSYTWVELRDDLTVSLLQARLIELNLPINVKVGTQR